MVGGTVSDIVVTPEKIWVECAERNDRCAIYVALTPQSMQIKRGDSLWWQAGKAYWRPAENQYKLDGRCGLDFDIPISKIGYSGARKPAVETAYVC